MSRYSSILDAKLTYLYSRVGGASIRLGLDTTLALLRELGVDPLQLPCVHIAGSNGKGSVSAMLSAVLQQTGLKVGLYTSPHLIRFTERIRINGQPIPDEELSRLLDEVEQADNRQAERDGARQATFFELTTAAAMKWFMDQQVQLVVLETGLGGRLDSTNVVDPLLTVITEIGLEHRDYLGSTLHEIAAEKAGIIKPGRPVVTARQHREVMEVIEQKAADLQAPLIRAEEQVSIRRTSQDLTGQVLSVETADEKWAPFRLPLLGDFQLENTMIAIAALEWLRHSVGLPLTVDMIRTGLEQTKWPGRCQVVMKDPIFLLDVAHNPDGATALAKFVKQFKGDKQVLLLCGMLKDKDAVEFFKLLRPVVDAAILLPLDSSRSMSIEALAAAAEVARLPAKEGRLNVAVKNAVKWAKKNNGMILAVGSVYLAAGVLYELGETV